MQKDFLAQAAETIQSLPGGETIFTIATFVIVLAVLVFVHELGHFLAARSVGIKVEKFSIGFGPVLARWMDKRGTQWQIAALPLGGFVSMLGESPETPLQKEDLPHAFTHKKIWQRAWVVIAGPAMNVVFAFVLLTAVMLTGEHRLKAEVGEVMPDMPAMGQLQEGDLITHFNGQPLEDWDAFQKAISDNLGAPLTLTVERENTAQTVTLTPQITEFTDLLGESHTVGRIGVAPSYATFVTTYAPHLAIFRAAEKTWEMTALTVTALGKLLIGAIPPDNLTGPLGIADMAGQTAANGIFAVLMFMVVISINLAIVNLFPLPILDGGHLVFLGLEKLRGKPLSPLTQEWLARAGLALILALVVFSTFNDINRFGWLSDKTDEQTEHTATE
ncbi:MAG: RIP metalloprotease RseP [Alphaproteobacteria bacterium CG_4_10_14_0_8_um_filter_53_9]|nr:MAG: RIP metalloprotease RseP [Alphaproteobacteria bacterium CG_4_10_14_0_8_um_filter_53_9]